MKKIILFLIVLFFANVLKAQEGFPDPSFGNNGYVVLDNNYTAIVKSDNKLVAVTGGVRGGFSVTRYNSDGTLDATFGNGGRITTTIPNMLSLGNGVVAAVQNDGKIVVQVVGGSDPGPSFIVALVRFNSNGSLDATFGSGGIVATFYPPTGVRRLVDAIGIQSDGKIVEVYTGSAGGRFYEILRYNPDGTRDASFQTSITQSSAAESLIIQNDQKIVIGGTQTEIFPTYAFVERRNSIGTPDVSFSQIRLLNESFRELAIDDDGKIVLLTNSNKLFRYNADGTPDLAFGNAGSVVPPFTVSIVLTQSDGKILAGGNLITQGANGHFLVARYNTDGSFDPSFAYGGMTAIAVAPNPIFLQSMLIINNRLYTYGSGRGYFAAFLLSSQSPSVVTTAAVQGKAIIEKIKGQTLTVLTTPNPATSYFVLRLHSGNNHPLHIRVMDPMGRTLEIRRNVASNNTIRLGDNYTPGIYYAEVIQGTKRITVKLIKGLK
jgi:uncharacterized delta-60 repeat protein